MENNELQKIWKSIDTEVSQVSVEELNLLLKSKTRQTINKYLAIELTSIVVSIGLTVFLVITSLNRKSDLIYLVNNGILGVITLTALISGLWTWRKLQLGQLNLPLKIWLEERINLLSSWFKGPQSKLYLFLLPVIYILLILSIHVYYENKPFIEVVRNDESVMGLLVGTPIGLFVAFFSVRVIRKVQLKNLEFLKDLHNRLHGLN